MNPLARLLSSTSKFFKFHLQAKFYDKKHYGKTRIYGSFRDHKFFFSFVPWICSLIFLFLIKIRFPKGVSISETFQYSGPYRTCSPGLILREYHKYVYHKYVYFPVLRPVPHLFPGSHLARVPQGQPHQPRGHLPHLHLLLSCRGAHPRVPKEAHRPLWQTPKKPPLPQTSLWVANFKRKHHEVTIKLYTWVAKGKTPGEVPNHLSLLGCLKLYTSSLF